MSICQQLKNFESSQNDMFGSDFIVNGAEQPLKLSSYSLKLSFKSRFYCRLPLHGWLV